MSNLARFSKAEVAFSKTDIQTGIEFKIVSVGFDRFIIAKLNGGSRREARILLYPLGITKQAMILNRGSPNLWHEVEGANEDYLVWSECDYRDLMQPEDVFFIFEDKKNSSKKRLKSLPGETKKIGHKKN